MNKQNNDGLTAKEINRIKKISNGKSETELNQQSKVIYFDKIISKEVKWLWFPYIPLGKIVLLAGDPSSGKTFAATYIASIISRGGIFPITNTKVEVSKVVFQNGEDGSADTIKPRLEQADADCEKIFVIDEKDIVFSLKQVARLEYILIKEKPRLIVIDPVQQYIGAKDMNSATEVRTILSKIGELADKYQCTIMFVCHLNKGEGKQEYRILGSIDLFANARSVIMIGKNVNSDDERIFEQIKNSLSEIGKPVAFKITDKGIQWLGISDSSLKDNNKTDNIPPNKFAKAFLKEELSNGDKTAIYMETKAKNLNISKSTLNRAKKSLGINSYQKGKQFYWTISNEG